MDRCSAGGEKKGGEKKGGEEKGGEKKEERRKENIKTVTSLILTLMTKLYTGNV